MSVALIISGIIGGILEIPLNHWLTTIFGDNLICSIVSVIGAIAIFAIVYPIFLSLEEDTP
jgi:hypothetical protein